MQITRASCAGAGRQRVATIDFSHASHGGLLRNLRRFAILGLILASACAGADDPIEPLRPDSLRVAQVVITPEAPSLYAGDTIQFHAIVRDSAGLPLDVPVRWESNNPTLLSVDASGRAIAAELANDASAAIIARAGIGLGQRTVSLTWRPLPAMWPDTNVLFVGMSRKLVVRVDSSFGAYSTTGPHIDTLAATGWTSGDAAIVSVDASGTLTAHAPGYTWIRAQAMGRLATGWVQVVPRPAEPLRFVSVSSGAVSLGFGRTNSHAERGCGLIQRGDVYCWGYGSSVNGGWSDRCEGYGRDLTRYYARKYQCTEIPVRLHTAESFYVMANNSALGCAINGARRVFCWGSNSYGEKGMGSADTLFHPVGPIASTDEFRSVHISEMFGGRGCALRMDDVLFCWGEGFGSVPKRVEGVSFRSLALAGRCGINTAGAMQCLPGHSAPVIAEPGLVEVAVQPWGPGVNCTRRGDGIVFCDNGSRIDLGEPALSVSTYWSGVEEAEMEVCAITASGVMRCGMREGGSTVRFPDMRWKSFFGNCGIATNEKTYCWRRSVIREVPGQ